MDVADPEVFRRDLEIYVTALVRFLNAEILPFDYLATTAEIRSALEKYQEQAGDKFSLLEVFRQLNDLGAELREMYKDFGVVRADQRHHANRTLLEVGRRLVPLDYSYGENFDHDPAEPLGAVPKLRDISKLKGTDPNSNEWWFLQTDLVRQRNKVQNALYETLQVVRSGRAALKCG